MITSLDEPRDEPKILYALALPGSRTRLGGVTLADREIARHEIKRQVFELVWLVRWLELIAPALATGKTVQEVLTLEQLRAMRSLSRPR